MRAFFTTAFRGARGLTLAFLLTLALGGAAYAVTTTTTTSDFSLTASTATASTSPGGTVGYGINLQATGGFSDNVSLAVTGLPSGASATFGTNPAFVDSSLASASTLWIDTSAATPPGSSTLNVTGTSSTGATHIVALTLTVLASGTPDYTVEMTPTTQYASAGSNVTYDVKVAPVNGFTGNVVLTARSVPGAVSLGWNGSTPVTAQNPSVTVPVGAANPGTAKLTVATTPTNPPGTYAITVTGTSASVSRTVAGTLDIDLFSATGSTSAPLYPGAGAQHISVALTDPYSYGVTITGLAASVARDSNGNVVNSGGSPVPGCLASWFKFADTPLSATNTLSLGAGASLTLPAADEPTVSLLDMPLNQDACKGVLLKLNFVGTAQH
jgi:hypothetical protein